MLKRIPDLIGRLAGRPFVLCGLALCLLLGGVHPITADGPQPVPDREYLLTVIQADGDSLPEILPTWSLAGRRLVAIEDLARLLRLDLETRGPRRELSLPGCLLRAEAGNRFVVLGGTERLLPGPAVESPEGLLVDHELLAPMLDCGLLKGSLDTRREEALFAARPAGLTSEALEGGHLLRLRLGQIPAYGIENRESGLTVDFPEGAPAGLAGLDHTWPTRPEGLLKRLQPEDRKLRLEWTAEAELVDVIEAESLGEIQVLLRRRGARLAEEFQPPPEPVLTQPKGQPIDLDVIVIDAGHGGNDPGAVSVKGNREKDVVLAVALKLRDELRRRMPGVTIVMTREDDRFLELGERTRLANKAGGKLFVSIHANAARNRSARGWEVFFLRPGKNQHAREVALRENSVIRFEEGGGEAGGDIGNWILASMAQSGFVEESQNLAALIYRNMQGIGYQRPRPVLQQGFYVLVGASMPAVLFETGFITNAEDERFLVSDSGQRQLAQALAESIVQFGELYGSKGSGR